MAHLLKDQEDTVGTMQGELHLDSLEFQLMVQVRSTTLSRDKVGEAMVGMVEVNNSSSMVEEEPVKEVEVGETSGSCPYSRYIMLLATNSLFVCCQIREESEGENPIFPSDSEPSQSYFRTFRNFSSLSRETVPERRPTIADVTLRASTDRHRQGQRA